ncbi:hypothetical protein AYI70_g2652 [Smittium culicis]|uniref:DUF1343 domain-containing protein n=1 Tax=Smittium culicis TaxID=133412 RepID=A0A1R1Y745_9FUNG|nr:hypothetical protein AYI70_g2652 [Smittium culicis]
MKFSFSVLAASLLGLTYGFTPINDNVQIGFDVWFQSIQDRCANKNVKFGLVLDASSISKTAYHDIDVILESNKIKVVGAIAPAKGIRSDIADGPQVSTGIYSDAATGVNVTDASGFTNGSDWSKAYASMKADVIVIDIQDVGSRFYPRIWSMYDALVGAALSGKKVIVLDRPNPINGNVVDGEVVSPGFESQIGKAPISIRHGMTIGELATMFNEEFLPKDSQLSESANKKAKLEVIKMKGWTRDMYFDQTGLNWFTPVQTIPVPDTALFYAGSGLFTEINISNGEGTTVPFEVFGAPYVADLGLQSLEQSANAKNVPGVIFRPMYFAPWAGKLLNVNCAGLQAHVQDRNTFQPISAAIASLAAMKDVFPDQYNFVTSVIDKYYGNSNLRTMLESGSSVQQIVDSYGPSLATFKSVRSKYLLY